MIVFLVLKRVFKLNYLLFAQLIKLETPIKLLGSPRTLIPNRCYHSACSRSYSVLLQRLVGHVRPESAHRRSRGIGRVKDRKHAHTHRFSVYL